MNDRNHVGMYTHLVAGGVRVVGATGRAGIGRTITRSPCFLAGRSLPCTIRDATVDNLIGAKCDIWVDIYPELDSCVD